MATLIPVEEQAAPASELAITLVPVDSDGAGGFLAPFREITPAVQNVVRAVVDAFSSGPTPGGPFDFVGNVRTSAAGGLEDIQRGLSSERIREASIIPGAPLDLATGGLKIIASPLTAASRAFGGAVEAGTGGLITGPQAETALLGLGARAGVPGRAAPTVTPGPTIEATSPRMAPEAIAAHSSQEAGRSIAAAETSPAPRAGNINLDRIFAPEDVRAAIAQSAAENAEFVAARRGVVTQEQTREMADLLGMSADDLAKRKIGQAFNAEEMFAARELLVTQATKVQEMARTARSGADIDKAQFAQEVTRLAAIQEQVSGATAEAGRALAQFRMMAGATREQIAAIVEASKATGIDELANKIADLNDIGSVATFAAKVFKAKTSDMLLEGWINALLSGPTTHATNILSNTLVSAWSIPERAVASALSKMTGSGIAGGEAIGRVFGILEGAKDGIRAAWRAFRTEEPSDVATKLDVRRFRAIPSLNIGGVEIGGKQIRIPGRLLQAEDEFFKAIGYRQEINSLAMRQAVGEKLSGRPLAERIAELKAQPTEAMMTAAREAAAKQTFSNPLGAAGKALTTITREIPALRVVMPFIRTPLNVVKYAAERSPFAPLFKDVRANLGGANGAAARDEQIARIALGSTVSAVAAYMATEGHITGGGPSDPAKRSLMRADGWQPYSVKIGGMHYSFSRLEPMGMLLGVAADFAEVSKAMTKDEQANVAALIMGSVSRNLVSKTWLQGPSDLIEAVHDPDRYGPRYIQRLIGTIIPTGVAQVARSNDPFLRDARGVLDTIKSRLPGERENLFIRRDAFGEQIKAEGAFGPDLLSPIYQSTARNDPTIAEMLRLNVVPGRAARKINNVEMEPAEHDAYSKAAGNLTKAGLDAIVALPQWSAIPDEAKKEMLHDVMRKSHDLARTSVIVKFPDLALRVAKEAERKRTFQPKEGK